MDLPTNVKRWAFYSFANHSYQVVYITFLLPVFFSTVLAGKGFSLQTWGAINGISTIFGVGIALFMGRYSDKNSKKLSSFKHSIILSLMGMVAIALSTKLFPSYFPIFLFLTNAVFIWSISLFDSILPYISTKETVYEYGGFSWGFGYLGGIMSLLLAIFLQKITGDYSLTVFLSVPIFYIIFSLYSLHGLRKTTLNTTLPTHKSPPLNTKEKGILFLGYWLISECITVIILFASLYLSQELHFSLLGVGLSLLAIQLIGFPATWYGGKLVGRYDSLKLLLISIVLWGLGIISLVFIQPTILGLVLAIIFVGCAYGNSQSYVRSQYSSIIEKKESGFQFGIYSLVSEAAVFIGPIIFGYASDVLHSQKIPLLTVFLLMIVGYGLIWQVMHDVKIETV
jgi:UMF1 family MFS transporter